MKSHILAAATLVLALAGCGGSGSGSNSSASSSSSSTAAVSINISALPAGSYSVSLGDSSAPTTGQYFSASDGSRLLIVNDENQQARLIYQGSANGGWQRIPAANADEGVSFLQTRSITLEAIDPASLAAHYSLLVGGAAYGFSLAADGKLSADLSSPCKLSGSLGADLVPGVRKLNLVASACTGLPASASGVAILDPDYSPARLRLLLNDGQQISELWAYAE